MDFEFSANLEDSPFRWWEGVDCEKGSVRLNECRVRLHSLYVDRTAEEMVECRGIDREKAEECEEWIDEHETEVISYVLREEIRGARMHFITDKEQEINHGRPTLTDDEEQEIEDKADTYFRSILDKAKLLQRKIRLQNNHEQLEEWVEEIDGQAEVEEIDVGPARGNEFPNNEDRKKNE